MSKTISDKVKMCQNIQTASPISLELVVRSPPLKIEININTTSQSVPPNHQVVKRLPNQLCFLPTQWSNVAPKTNRHSARHAQQPSQRSSPQNFYSCLDEPTIHDAIIDSGTPGHLAPCAAAPALNGVLPASDPVSVMVSTKTIC